MKIQWTFVGLFVCGIIGVIAGSFAVCNYGGDHIQAAGALTLVLSFLAIILPVMIHD